MKSLSIFEASVGDGELTYGCRCPSLEVYLFRPLARQYPLLRRMTPSGIPHDHHPSCPLARQSPLLLRMTPLLGVVWGFLTITIHFALRP